MSAWKLVAIAAVLAGCSAPVARSGFETDTNPTTPAKTTPTTSGSIGNSTTNTTTQSVPTTQASEVFGHSGTTLYKLDPGTKAVTVVGDFKDCGDSVLDIALDGSSNMFATTSTGLFSVALTSAQCTQIALGDYPNSLSFVPAGTADANVEALVGYDGSDYVRIDPKTGAKTTIGSIGSGDLVSSGDVVAVKGGSTYLTVSGTGCDTDCLIEVDPKSGALVKNWGPTGFSEVYGLAFWAGKVYGFDNAGDLFEIALADTLTTTPITIPQTVNALSFYGAGSTTSAPVSAPK